MPRRAPGWGRSVVGLAERRSRRRAECRQVATVLPAWVAGEAQLDERCARHVAQCLRCQAEAARYRRMLRALHGLRLDTAPPPPGALSDLLARIDAVDRADRTEGTPSIWAVAVAAAAGALGAVAVLAWISRKLPAFSG
jgi:hypothetical protein